MTRKARAKEAKREAREMVRELGAFIEAHPDLHFCSAIRLLATVPPHLLPAAQALIEVDLIHGNPDAGPPPRGLLNNVTA